MNFWLGISSFIFLTMINTKGSKASVSNDGAEFGLAMLQEVRSMFPKENIFFSPTSIQITLAMLLEGTRGDTRDQLKSVILSQTNSEDAAGGFSEMIQSLNEQKDFALHLANGMFPAENFSVNSNYQNVVTSMYQAQLDLLDYNKFEEARTYINEWVEGKTNDLIKNLLPLGSVDITTVLILANTLYFKAEWLQSFPDPRISDFTTQTGDIITTNMMTAICSAQYLRDGKTTHLALPYKGKEVQFIISLPDTASGVLDLEKSITASKMLEVMDADISNVQVTMPEFEMKQVLPLKILLESLGIVCIFDELCQADLSGISSDKIYVSDAFHKAVLKVTVNGTEAAAATAVPMNMRSAGSSFDDVFIADHPFMLSIVHVKTRSILFMGTLMNPPVVEEPNQLNLIARFGAEFSLNFLRGALADAGDGNVIYSPHAILNALFMFSDIDKHPNSLKSIKNLNLQLTKGTDHFRVSLINGLFYDYSLGLMEPSFKNMLQKSFKAMIERESFQAHTAQSRLNINQWVAEMTAYKVLELIPRYGIIFTSQIILANSILLTALWDTPFPPAVAGFFNLLHEGKVPVEMFVNDMDVQYYQGEFDKHLNIPMSNGEISFRISMPIQKHHFWKMVLSLNMEKLEEVESKWEKTKMRVTLPKLDFTENVWLKDILMMMNIESRKPLDGNIPESGRFSYSNNSPLTEHVHWSNIFHRTFIQLTKFGVNNYTKLHASQRPADDTNLPSGFAAPALQQFTADHPFIFYIVHEASSTILYHGAIMNPNTGLNKAKDPPLIPGKYKLWARCYYHCLARECGKRICDTTAMRHDQLDNCARVKCKAYLDAVDKGNTNDMMIQFT